MSKEGEECEIEEILDKREVNGKIKYKVKWKGFWKNAKAEKAPDRRILIRLESKSFLPRLQTLVFALTPVLLLQYFASSIPGRIKSSPSRRFNYTILFDERTEKKRKYLCRNKTKHR